MNENYTPKSRRRDAEFALAEQYTVRTEADAALLKIRAAQAHLRRRAEQVRTLAQLEVEFPGEINPRIFERIAETIHF